MSKIENSLRGRRTEEVGVVTSSSMTKTVSVKIPRTIRHARYGKILRRSVVFKAHDPNGLAKVGDQVLLFQSRPTSKTKRWKVAKVLIKGFDRGVQNDSDAK